MFVIKTGAPKKVPIPGLEFASQGFSCEIQVEPPPDIREDRAKLKRYVEALFDECGQRVQDQVEQASSSPASPTNAQRKRRHHRPMTEQSPRQRGNGSLRGQASPKQVNFIRSLGSQAGFSHDDLAYMAEEAFGKRDLRSLTKKEASALIDNLQSGEES